MWCGVFLFLCAALLCACCVGQYVNMLPFILGDMSSLPLELHGYAAALKSIPLQEEEKGQHATCTCTPMCMPHSARAHVMSCDHMCCLTQARLVISPSMSGRWQQARHIDARAYTVKRQVSSSTQSMAAHIACATLLAVV